MGLLREISVYLLCLAAVGNAIPLSLIEDIKDAQLQAPLRTNKVKRAQEVLMFGNQQNRAVNNYGSPRTEKRDIGDNTLAEDVATLPNILPQVEEQVYDTNQLSAGSQYEKAYPYIGREPSYGMLLRNAALKESLHNEPVLGYGDLPLYNMMDARRKRDAHKPMSSTTKNSFRSKREYDLSPEEMVSIMRLIDSQRKQNNRFHDQSRTGWPLYNADTDDVDFSGDNVDETENETEPENYNRYEYWLEGPVGFGNSPRDGEYWQRKYKRFMVSKRRSDGDSLGPINSPYDFPEGVPLQRRFIL